MTTPLIGAVTRIIIFVKDVPVVAAFYTNVLGLQPIDAINDDWVELSAGGCNIALHKANKTGAVNTRSAKVVFGVKDVQLGKKMLEEKGAVMSKIYSFKEIEFCDGKDPEGNAFQISNRGL